MTVYKWSQTPASNDTADATINWREGMGASRVNDSARAMMAAVAKYRDDTSGLLETGGTSTAYTVSTSQGFAALANGLTLRIRPHTTSGSAPTLNVDSLGAKPLRAATGTALGAGHMIAGSPYDLTYFSSADEWLLADVPALPYVVPLGGIMEFPSLTPPSSNFALMNGQAISRTTYASLFSLIGTTFGPGNGSTTFNIPDLRGRVVVGHDSMGSSAAGRVSSVSFSPDALTLGASGGAQTFKIEKEHLPNYTLTDTFALTGTTSSLVRNQSFTTRSVSSGAGSAVEDINFSTTSIGLTGSVTLGGSGTTFSIVQPSVILAKLMRVL